jgi:acyl-CoA synthetase (AMP-forming)/AMP-acid ligase II
VLRDVQQPPEVFGVRDSDAGGSSYEALLAEDGEETPLPQVDPASIKTVNFTSGTTGRPKGVLHSHFTVQASVRRATRFWNLDSSDRLLVPSPVGHIGGSLYAFELPWFTGVSAQLMETWDAARAVELIDRDKATFCAGATPFLQGLLDCAQRAGSTLPSLRRFVCGGAAVTPALVKAATQHFENAVVSRAYGSTEIPLICPGIRTRVDADYGQTTDGEIDAEVRIVDQSDHPVPSGIDGDIVVRSPSAFVGYLQSEDEDGQFTEDGYFRMGDIGQIVDNSFLRITGRRKEIIIRLGENISAPEVENALMECQAVKRAAVVGIPNARTGERAVAFVELKPGRELSFANMQECLKEQGMAKQKFPEELHILDELPMNAIGKVLKLELKELAEKASGG